MASPTHAGYRHEAFLYRGEREFLAGTLPFVRDAVAEGQPVMVAVVGPRMRRLRTALGQDAARVQFVDMAELGGNPARIIPGWRRFVDQQGAGGQPVRGVGEPVWAGRRGAEVAECQLHEALLNLTIEPDTPLWLRCPYDVDALDGAVVDAAHRTHPILVGQDGYRGSTVYGGAHHADLMFGGPLPAPLGDTDELRFAADGLHAVRQLVTRHAADAGVGTDRAADLALAVHEIAANSIDHGGGGGAVRVWREPTALVCEVRDRGRVGDLLVGRRAASPTVESGRGLWLANQLCDLVQIRSSRRGTAVRVLTWL